MTFAERAAADPALRAFVDAEIARAGIEVHTAKVELEHQARVIADLKSKVAELEAAARSKGKK